MEPRELIPHLFRREYGRIVSVLAGRFGVDHLDAAEDLASETFLTAMETWPYRGIPENPVAWLYTVARNKASNHLQRENLFREKIAGQLLRESTVTEPDIDLSDRNITDHQLQMLFTVCHPSVPQSAQIALALRVLCGFGIDEIAAAFLTNKDTVNKRLHRAKRKLRDHAVQLEVPADARLAPRLESVLRTLYLLFSEGYYSERNDAIVRKELCLEAVRLTYLLLGNPSTDTHASNALLSLMCFHSSRLDARLSDAGEPVLYRDQDTTRWDTALIEKGFYYLQRASQWEVVSKYYLEASIAYWHTVQGDSREKWESVLSLYDALLTVDPTPLAQLNRLYALAKVRGNAAALREAEGLPLHDNHFYHLLLSELTEDTDPTAALESLRAAYRYCGTETERVFIAAKMERLATQLRTR
ncbi:RNA polymerase sigma-70 factor (ECF subfamily) [Neolewinella xylanilytica]|uniref:RNA polymerase sigma-70 factor (ECF subfamily) n=1 Tax=Neolewinella xylanilytica TaxID=1514080 RepID=A0A2S6I853_9BACT|nr:sigma-70 family RNA polymerase sigma factor [Neolewinella xylanilytica]PPK87673.1 RNA polymerase sigma-70 factor (ECF subfamily) [Neolewinella xylanilytica]